MLITNYNLLIKINGDFMKNVYGNLEETQELFLSELEDFTRKYDFLGEITLTEDPDIDTIDYIYSIENLNGKTMDELDPILDEICVHMRDFSKENNIFNYYVNACFSLW